jgi:serine protease Do
MTLIASQAIAADTIQLKDKNSAISGKILAEKKDQVAVDVGYTVLVIPRSQIARIIRGEKGGNPVPVVHEEETPAAAQPVHSGNGLYETRRGPVTVRNVKDLVNELGEAVVQVRTPGGIGSGFFLNEDGFLITNFHVIEGETQISVEVYHQLHGQLDRKSYKDVRIIAMNKVEDLALLKIEDKNAPKFKRVVLGSTEPLGVGERVFAVGSPLGLERTVTEGILSTKTRQMQGKLYLQTTTQINPGNSGGPLFNMAGEVIGVTNMKITFGEGLGFAIPIEAVRFFLDHRDAYAYSNHNPSNPFRYLEPPSRIQHTRPEPVE